MSRIESYTRMFSPGAANGDVITRVEIPLIQRDYAQGRRGEKVDEIRRNFLHVLRKALDRDEPERVSLDFVYGELKTDGTLQPLDGQQRLTTLFLLHWYLSCRSGELAEGSAWTNFTYETRPSARRFCQRLVASCPPAEAGPLSDWIQNQPWYLYVWRHDPTINSMLVMLDAIDDEFADVDAQRAWKLLTDEESPAISFHLLPLPDMGSAEDLYVKMNSRGKPLTDFENFKARFERMLDWSPEHAAAFARKADTDWADVLWHFRGDDDLVDDEFLRYFDFVTELCEWNDDQLGSGAGTLSRLQRASRVFGHDNSRRSEHVAFLFTAFDVWTSRDVSSTFKALFGGQDAPGETLPLFFRDPNINLFEAACRSYGETGGGGNRAFTFGQTLILYAVVLNLAGAVDEPAAFPMRLRSLRNLVEGSQFEMRADRMPRLIADARALVQHGTLPQPGNTFSVAQISDESDKQTFLAQHPEQSRTLCAVEDHPILKGSTSAFALEAETLAARWEAFESVMADPNLWWDLTGALLSVGEYQWPRQRNGTLTDSESFQFGTWDGTYRDSWREVLVGRTRKEVTNTAEVLGSLLDAVTDSASPVDAALRQMQDDWLKDCEEVGAFDWRYYVVKYRDMRAGASGLYYAHGRRMGFSLTNLPGGKKYRNAYFHDPYLLTIYRALDEPQDLQRPTFSGYEWDPRWLRLSKSGTGIRCIATGFELLKPTDADHLIAFEAFAHGVGAVESDDSVWVSVKKATDDDSGPDSEDRIQFGTHLIRSMVEGGL